MKKIIFTLLIAISVQFASAQQDEDYKKDALKVVELSGAKTQLQLTKNQLLKAIPKDKHKIFSDEFDSSLTAIYEKYAKLYMKLYTKEDLKAIIQFYETPVGKKMSTNNTELAIRSTTISQEWMASLQEIIKKHTLPSK